MAFNNSGTVTSIAPGATHSWTYSFSDNHGFQAASADVKTPGAELLAFDQGERMESNGHITYFVSIRNVGTVSCLYNLHGGGAS